MPVWDALLDASVVFSFDRTGFERHSRAFDLSLETLPARHGIALITGGTSGLGLATAEFLSSKSITCMFTGRNADKGETLEAKIAGSRFIQLDMADWGAIKNTVDQIVGPIDYLVLNAGGMPDHFKTNASGIEYQFASQYFGHYFLLRYLIEQGKAAAGVRVVWVSSGGMYLQKLHLTHLYENAGYDKVKTYANVKRAQVILNEELARDTRFSSLHINAMHPGWVDTPGIQTAIPGFIKLVGNRLRSAQQGADTILWLLLDDRVTTSGKLYFDRRVRSPYAFFWTKEAPEERRRLIELTDALYDEAFATTT